MPHQNLTLTPTASLTTTITPNPSPELQYKSMGSKVDFVVETWDHMQVNQIIHVSSTSKLGLLAVEEPQNHHPNSKTLTLTPAITRTLMLCKCMGSKVNFVLEKWGHLLAFRIPQEAPTLNLGLLAHEEPQNPNPNPSMNSNLNHYPNHNSNPNLNPNPTLTGSSNRTAENVGNKNKNPGTVHFLE